MLSTALLHKERILLVYELCICVCILSFSKHLRSLRRFFDSTSLSFLQLDNVQMQLLSHRQICNTPYNQHIYHCRRCFIYCRHCGNNQLKINGRFSMSLDGGHQFNFEHLWYENWMSHPYKIYHEQINRISNIGSYINEQRVH